MPIDGLSLELRACEGGFLAGQDRGSQGLEVRAFGKQDQLRRRELFPQRGNHGRILRHPAHQQHAPQRALALFHERDHFVRHAVVECVQDVVDARLVPIELVSDVGLAVDGATRSQGNELALKRAPHGLVQFQSQSRNLLDQELTAAGCALVVRKDGDDPRPFQQVDYKDLSAQGGRGIEVAADVIQRRLRRGDLGNMPPVPRHAKGRSGRIFLGEPLDQLMRPALMVRRPEMDLIPVQGRDLHGQGADIDPDACHTISG